MPKWFELAPPGYKLRLDIEKKKRKLLPPWLQEEPDFAAEEQAGLTALAETEPSYTMPQPLQNILRQGQQAKTRGILDTLRTEDRMREQREASIRKWGIGGELGEGQAQAPAVSGPTPEGYNPFFESIEQGKLERQKGKIQEYGENIRSILSPTEEQAREMARDPLMGLIGPLPVTGAVKAGSVASRFLPVGEQVDTGLIPYAIKAGKAAIPLLRADQRGGIKLPGGAGSRGIKSQLKIIDENLVYTAIEKAKTQGDEYNLTRYQGLAGKALTPGTRNDLNMYIFGSLEGGNPEQLLKAPKRAPKPQPGQAPLAQAAPPVREGVDEAVESAIREAKPPAAESVTVGGRWAGPELLTQQEIKAINRKAKVAPTTTGSGVAPQGVARLPRELSGAKSRYNIGTQSWTPQFESDIDKALYTVGQTTPNKRHDDYMGWLRQQLPGKSDVEIQAMGKQVRASIKGIVRGQPEGPINIPSSGIGKADFTPAPEPVPPTKVAQGEAAITPSPVKPTVAAAPQPGAGVTPPVKPPRQPNYNAGERATETVPAVPPRQPPPIDTTPIPTETPSGRKPGGIGRQTELPAVDEYSKHVEALTPTKTALRDKVTDFRDNLVRNFADRNSPLAELEKITGIPTHKLAQVVPGGTGAGEDIVRTQFRPAWKPVTKDVDYLEQYMVAMRDQDILARNRSANLPGSVQGWEGTLKAMEGLKNKIGPERYAAIEKAAKELWRLNDEQVLTPLVNEGILSKEAYQAMKSSNPHYIPFQREDFLTGIESHFVTPEASVSSTGIKRMNLAGSERKLDQPLARLEAGVIRSQQTIFRNRAAKGIVAALQELETQTGAPILKYIEPKRELRTIERVTGEKIPRGIKGEHSQNRETIGFFQDGKKVVVEVPALYGEVAKSLDWPVSNLLSKVIMTVNAPLRHGATTYAPSFLVSNPFGDAFSAFFQTGLIPLSPHYFKGWAAAVKKNPLYSEAARSGVFMSGLVETASDMTALKRVQSMGSITVHNPKDALLLVPRLLRKANIISEQATRAAVYSRSRAQGLSQLESAIMARNATVDFSKMGPVMRIINQVIPFTNPALQGTINLGGRIKRNPVSALLVASPFATATVLTRVNNMRFETSKDIPQYEYTNYWVIQIGEGTHKNGTKFPIYFKLPKRQVGSILSWPAELTFNILQKQNNRSAVEMVLDSSIETAKTLSPIEPAASGVLPPPVQTGMGLEANKNFFTGQPIVPEYQKNLPAEEQFTERTSETAIVIGQAVNVSPAKIDFAIKDYLAGAGQSGLWLTDLALNAVGIKNGEADPSFVEKLAQAPVTGRLVGTKQTQQGEKRQLAEQQFPEQVAALKPGEPLPPGVKSQVELSPEGRAIKEQAGRATPEDKIKWEDYDKRVKRDNEYRQARMSPTDWRDTFHNDNLVRMAQSELKERLGMIRKKDRKNMSDTEKVLDDYYTMMENLSDPHRTGRLLQGADQMIVLWEAKLTDKQRQDLKQNLHPRATDMEKEYYTDMDNLKPYFDVVNKSPLITDKGKTKAMNDINVLENRARQLQVAGDWQGAQMAAYEAQKLDAIYQITGWRKYLNVQKKMLRGQNPEIDRLLVKWGYVSKPLQPLPAPTPKRELAGVR